MQQDIERFLNLKNPPGRLTREEAAWFLGFSPDEITILVSRGLLKPLGHPAANGQKFFLTAVLEELKRDEKWYSKATDAVTEYWRNKNFRKRWNPEGNQQHSPPSEDRAGNDLAQERSGQHHSLKFADSVQAQAEIGARVQGTIKRCDIAAIGTS